MNLNCRRSIFIECKGYANELDTSDSFLPMADFNFVSACDLRRLPTFLSL